MFMGSASQTKSWALLLLGHPNLHLHWGNTSWVLSLVLHLAPGLCRWLPGQSFSFQRWILYNLSLGVSHYILFPSVLGIRIRNRILGIRLLLALPDSDPLVRGTDPEPAPAPNPALCWADWNNACKIKILAKNKIYQTEDNVPVGKL